ncbi:hypothetical protein MVEN_02457800 [Mycena venus]|uniref:Uncharacterized protein n=1 Tax=Mycena venus TaxID=2733690 RepID=A0A8H7CBJ6_9AGAR|nr:hypothetical protein MVEN_02457800 [Mycena venus]
MSSVLRVFPRLTMVKFNNLLLAGTLLCVDYKTRCANTCPSHNLLPVHLFSPRPSFMLFSRPFTTMFPALVGFVFIPLAAGHSAFWHPSMYGFNVTDKTFDYDNRPVSPLMNMTFSQWWFHGHLDFPPNEGDLFELPAGKPATAEIACNKGATSFFASSEGGDIRTANPNDVCPNSGTDAFHTKGFDDLTGCALAIAYNSDATNVQPEDFTVFSVNQTCVWTRFTDFQVRRSKPGAANAYQILQFLLKMLNFRQVPARMPPCPAGGCTCAFFWIHSPDSGGEQNYMNGFKCNVTGSTSTVPLATPKVARRCGADSLNGKWHSAPGNCTYGAKQPLYWFQQERNNMFEGTYAPPFYTDLYEFRDGPQNDIFEDSYAFLLEPSPTAPLPVLNSTSSTSFS